MPTTCPRVPRLHNANASFGRVLGFSVGSYPSVATFTPHALISNIVPQVNPVSTYILRCSMITNPFQSPDDIMTSIEYTTSEYLWMTDQNFNLVKFNDKDVLITLANRLSQLEGS